MAATEVKSYAVRWLSKPRPCVRRTSRTYRRTNPCAAAKGASSDQPAAKVFLQDEESYKTQVEAMFDRRGPVYDVDDRYHPPLARRLLELAAPRPGMVALDVACGTGLVLLDAAAAVGPSGRVVGVDLSAEMLKQAEEKVAARGLTNVTLIRGDVMGDDVAEALRRGAAGFDLVTCSSALLYMPNVPAALSRFASWLSPGGRLAVNSPKQPSVKMFDAWRALTATKGLLIADPAAQLPDAAAALRLFGEAGFEDVQVSTEPGCFRLSQTPEEYAARMWRSCTSSPFAPADKLLSPEDLESMRPRFWELAVRHAEACASADGFVEDPFVQMYIVATLAA